MKARAAVKDVARVLRIPPGDADKLTKLIPSGPGLQPHDPGGAEEGRRAPGAGGGQSAATSG